MKHSDQWKTTSAQHKISSISQIEYRDPRALRPYANNARTHSAQQVAQIAASIEEFGFTNPVLLTDEDEIVAGHGRVLAALQLNLSRVPTVRMTGLNDAQKRAYILADNKLAENAGWDQDLLAIELQHLSDLDFELDLTGFSIAEIDFALDSDIAREDEDSVPVRGKGKAQTNPGDFWELGAHRLLCGDAQNEKDVVRLCQGARMDLIFTDPPYNVAINGHVSGNGQARHEEFAFASGDMSRHDFVAFLECTLKNAAKACKDGAIAFVCMDWRHMSELMEAGNQAFDEMKNLCVWNKTNAGMGTFYRSKHELVFVFKVGRAPHTNSFGLGDSGRYRTNVWDYAGANVVGSARDADLAMHPTVKPVALVEDAIRDCSRRGEHVLDVFGGSGSTLIAAERCGRKARLLEYDPGYCDVILRRFALLTGQTPINAESGIPFDVGARA